MHYLPSDLPRVSCGIPLYSATIPGYRPGAPRVKADEATAERLSVTCRSCVGKMGNRHTHKILLSDTQIGVLLYFAGRIREANEMPKPREATYEALLAMGLIERIERIPFHQLNDHGRHWLNVNRPTPTV